MQESPSGEPVRAGTPLGPTLSRRSVLAAISLLPLAALSADFLAPAMRAGAATPYRFFSPHQAAVVVAATARLVPGPADDPAEAGHPGAREAGVVRYIDTLLGAFSFAVPPVHAGGPWSDRHGGAINHMATFVALDPAQAFGWKLRVDNLQKVYAAGIVALDAAATGHDFSVATALEQDRILTAQDGFRDQLFMNTIEGMYSVPEYGGNAGLVGWRDIAYPGDSQPVGYTADEVRRSDGLAPIAAGDLPIVEQLLRNLPLAAAAIVTQGWPRRKRPASAVPLRGSGR